MDDVWILVSLDAAHVRKSRFTFRFDVIVAPGKRLSSPEYLLEKIAAKEFVYWSCKLNAGRSLLALQVVYNDYLLFVRWRLHRLIPSNQSMNEFLFSALFTQIESSGLRGLLPGDDRLRDFVEAVKMGFETIPVESVRSNVRFAPAKLNAKLGVPSTRFFSLASVSLVHELLDSRGIKFSPRKFGIQEKVSANRVHQFFGIFNSLHAIRDYVRVDPLEYYPFYRANSSVKVARRIASTHDRRTRTIPPLQVCSLLNVAIEWVLVVAPVLEAAASEIHQARTALVEANASSADIYAVTVQRLDALKQSCSIHESSIVRRIGELITTKTAAYRVGFKSKGTYSLGELLYIHLVGACLTVIASFTARRSNEIESLKSSCVVSIDGEPWIETWISKTLRAMDRIPIPPSVKFAVEVLERLSKRRREKEGVEWLFCFSDNLATNLRSANIDFPVNEPIGRFCEIAEVPKLPGGDCWRPRAHEFRRFFAITYFYRFRYGHLTALSAFLRHYDVGMTRRYITESVRGEISRIDEELSVAQKRAVQASRLDRLNEFSEAALEFRIDTLRSIAAGEIRVGGFGGEAIKGVLEEATALIRGRLDLRASDPIPDMALNSIIAELAGRIRLEPNGLGHSYCKCTRTAADLGVANCLRDGRNEVSLSDSAIAPDPGNAGDLTCSACPHNVQLPENEAYWSGRIECEGAALSCAVAPLLREMLSARLVKLTAHYDRCFR